MASDILPAISNSEIEQAPRRQTHTPPRGMEADLEQALRRRLEGEVRFDQSSKGMYAVDASNYRHVPIGVVIPRSREDVINTVAVCRQFDVPLLSRGGGTSLAGQCCNVAIVMDWTKYMQGVLETNLGERWARVLPGTVCDQLRHRVLQESDNLLTWGPDPATHSRCTFGGMIGNNSCGAHAQMSGKCDNNIEELEVLLYDGTIMRLGWMTDADLERAMHRHGREAEVYRQLKQLRDLYEPLIRARYAPIPRRVSGYNLDQLIPGEDGKFNLARALVGSEGTLITILEARCKLIDARMKRVILMLGYPDVYEAADHVMEIDPFNPTALEGIDDRLYTNIEKKGGPHRKYLPMLPEGKGWLMCEFGADKKEDAIATAREVMETLGAHSSAPAMRLFTGQEDMEHLWEIRESGLGATAFVPGEKDTWPGWEDSAVAPEKLGGYLRDLRALFTRFGYQPSLYGHFGQGCVHCRVDFDVATAPGIAKWRHFMEAATDLVVHWGGSLSGEHGDGQARAEFLHKMFGEDLLQAFRGFKSIWDPAWKMNPGKIIDPEPFDSSLRLGAHYAPWEPETHFQYPEDHGSFAHAALRCVGIGKCRRQNTEKAEDATMCPSFMVTQEERHSTRGRARLLWEMLQGNRQDGAEVVITEGWKSEAVKEALDLCLSCKGCKGDCPVNVDMATYKAEFLSHYYDGRLRNRQAYAFGWIDQWARLAALAPGFVNLVTQLPGLSNVAKLIAGMPQARSIPAFAPQTFQQWWSKRREQAVALKPQVLLWPDTFNNHFHPQTAQAAVDVFETLGFDVVVPEGHVCCGRPLYDYGFLGMARDYLNKTLAVLKPHLDAGTPIVMLEPSCCSVFRDEINGLLPHHADAHRLMESTFTLSEFLLRHEDRIRWPRLERKALVQGHCHHKAIMRLDADKTAMEKMGLDYQLLNTGCCGMAGSFGFEAGEKYEVSVACAERALLPEVRKAGLATIIMADGFSCKEQIAQETNRQALHLAQVVQMALRKGSYGPPGIYPEQQIVAEAKRARNKSMWRAAAVLGAAVVAGAAIWALRRK